MSAGKPIALLAVTVMVMGLQLVTPAPAHAQQFPAFPGATFEERRQAYFDNQGAAWKKWFPSSTIHAIWAWLERPKGNEANIQREIQYYLTHDHDGWKNGWYTGDHRVILPLRWYLQYYLEKKVLSEAHASEIKERLSLVAGNPNIWGAAPNFNFRYLVTGYLYTYLIEDVGNVHFYQDDTGPESFTIKGRSYTHGKHYPSREVYRDYLSYCINGWLRGTGEHFSDPYYYAQVHSMAALADFAPDDELRRKGRMLFDFLIFDWAVGFSANHPAGGNGRTYSHYEENGNSEFPWVVFFDLYGKPDIEHRNTYADGYVFKHRFPQFLTNIVEQMWKGEGDDFYRIIRGKTNLEHPDSEHEGESYRYAYVTPNYNLGGTGEGTGWELNIKSDSVPFKLFISRCNKPYDPGCNIGAETPYLFFMGYNGNQHRNALFVHSGGTLQQSLSNPWDEQSAESGWQFFREGKAAVAVQIAKSSSALEVATIGVDYPSFDTFKNAIKTKARLSPNSFTTSKGVAITKGYVDSKLPFDRLEVWEGHVGKNDEAKIVDWRNNVMTVSKNGRKCIYDFNTWQTRGNGFDATSSNGFGTSFKGSGKVDYLAYHNSPRDIHGYSAGLDATPSYDSNKFFFSSSSEQPEAEAHLMESHEGNLTEDDDEGNGGGDNRKPSPPASDGYPRIGGQVWGGARPEWYAKFDLNMLGVSRVDAQLIQDIKAINPNSKVIFTADINGGIHLHDSNPGGSPRAWYVSTGDGPCDPKTGKNCCPIYGDNAYLHDWSTSSGRGTWDPAYPNLQYKEYVPIWYITINDGVAKYADGVASDGFWGGWSPCNKPPGWEEGAAELLRDLRKRLGPTKLIVMNGGGYDAAISGPFLEHFGNPMGNNWNHFWSNYQKWMRELNEPHGIMFDGKVYRHNLFGGLVPNPSKNFFRHMRYLLGLALLGDAYFSFSDVEAREHYYLKYYDEFDINLGKPASEAQPIKETCRQAPIGGGDERCVWVRFFENGLSLANTTGAPVTITDSQLKGLSGYDPGSDGKYHHFRGGQDSGTNTGKDFTSVTLKGDLWTSGDEKEEVGDGIILTKDPTVMVSEIYIDNNDPGTSPSSQPAQLTGNWEPTCAPPGNSNDIHHDSWSMRCAEFYEWYDYVVTTSPSAQAVYAPAINVSGQYAVYEWHGTYNGQEATNVAYTVHHAGGSETRTVNQRVCKGRWNLLGVYRFEAGSGGKVTISAAGADGPVIADALKFVYQGNRGNIKSTWTFPAKPCQE